jgi:hypothetical protein
MTVRFRLDADVVAQRLDDEVVLIQLKTDRIFVLNRTGARLWELLAGGHELAEIQRQMVQEFDVGENQLAAETTAFLSLLAAEHLVIPDEAT